MKKITLIIFTILAFPLFLYAEPKASSNPNGYHVNKNYDLIPNDKNSSKKVILITIDDGPTIYGKGMADTLVKHKAGAIFFINGIHAKNNIGNIEYQYKAGFSIGNHTWDHLNLKQEKKTDKIKKEIESNTDLIKKITGSLPKFFRAPYGASTPYVKDLVNKDGMIYMNWSGAAKDWEKNTKDEKIFMKNITKDLHPGEILLIHEHAWTAKYLDDLLTTLEQKGYTFADPNQITN